MLLYCVLAATGAPKRQDFFALLDAQDVGEARRGVGMPALVKAGEAERHERPGTCGRRAERPSAAASGARAVFAFLLG